ncbi:MAG: PilN domain-containing protein [Desulfatitalea sp.]|nr:PilN domain-containing protein [Desulfatitalea sp.]MBI5896904.1 PilN domain-containing protein [Desulfobacterales bacterium]
MIRINLLPYRAARKKENIRFQLNVFIGSIVFALLAVFWYNSMLNGSISDLNGEIATTREQVTKYQAINKEIEEIKKTLAVIEKKIEVITSLERDRKAPVQNLDSIYQLLVEKRMWYSQIEEKGDSFKISGVAIDNQTVADYMTRIEKSERFQNVRLVASKQYKLKDKEDLSLKQFDVNFQKKTATQKPAEVKKK